MVISDLNFLAEVTTKELAIIEGGQTEVQVPTNFQLGRGGRTATLTLNVAGFVNNNNLGNITSCDAIYIPNEDGTGQGIVSIECNASEKVI